MQFWIFDCFYSYAASSGTEYKEQSYHPILIRTLSQLASLYIYHLQQQQQILLFTKRFLPNSSKAGAREGLHVSGVNKNHKIFSPLVAEWPP